MDQKLTCCRPGISAAKIRGFGVILLKSGQKFNRFQRRGHSGAAPLDPLSKPKHFAGLISGLAGLPPGCPAFPCACRPMIHEEKEDWC